MAIHADAPALGTSFRGVRVLLYGELGILAAAVLAYYCSPLTCPGLTPFAGLGDLFVVFLGPLAAALVPPAMIFMSFRSRTGWLRGLLLVILSLAMSYLLLGIWVGVFS